MPTTITAIAKPPTVRIDMVPNARNPATNTKSPRIIAINVLPSIESIQRNPTLKTFLIKKKSPNEVCYCI